MLKELFSLKKRKERPGIGGLLKSVFFLAIGVMCVFALSYAWFNNNKNGNVEDIEFMSVESIGFQISLKEEGPYTNSVTIEYPDNLVFSPVSGNGSELYSPKLPVGYSNLMDDEIDWTRLDWGDPLEYDKDAETNPFYWVTLYFTSDTPGYVAFSPSNIKVDPAAPPENRQSANYTGKSGDVTIPVGAEVIRPIQDSIIKNIDERNIITKDYIAAASRVYIYSPEEDTDEIDYQNDSIIVPNSKFLLSYSKKAGSDVYSYSMNEVSSNPVNGELLYYNGSGISSYDNVKGFVYKDGSSTEENVYLIRLKWDETKKLYYGFIEVTIWIEGFDHEADNILAGGEITCSMAFKYMEDPPLPQGN